MEYASSILFRNNCRASSHKNQRVPFWCFTHGPTGIIRQLCRCIFGKAYSDQCYRLSWGSNAIFIFPEHVLGWFIRTPDTLTKAIFPLRIDCISLWFSIIGLILMQSLIGAQKSTLIMKITICFEWGLFVPTMFVLQQMGYGLNILWIFSAIISSFKTIYLIVIWKEGNWKH